MACHTLFEWSTPSSPHTAAALEGRQVTDEQLLAALRARLDQIDEASQSQAAASSFTIVETAGGVLSPGTASHPPLAAERYHSGQAEGR